MAIYNGTQKIDMSGVDKVYVGTQLVYQKAKILTNLQMSEWDTTYGRSMSYQGVSTAVWYQNQYDTFSFNGSLYASYSDGSFEDVTSQCSITGYNMSNVGTQNISVSYTYNGVTMSPTNVTSFKLSVVKEVDHIVLSSYKSQLDQNSTFDFGGTVTAYYTDNSTANVTADCTFSGYDMSTVGTYTVTVTYNSKWSAFDIYDYTTSTATGTYQLSVMTPTVYRRLEYVETNNGAAINTEMKAATDANNLNKFYLKVMPYTVTSGGQYRILANYTSSATLNRKYALVIHGAGQYYRNVLGSSWQGSSPAQANVAAVIESSVLYNDRYITVDGVKEALTAASSDTGTTGQNYGFGGGVNGTTVGENAFNGRLYGLKATRANNANLAWYYIPVQRKSDNKVGFALIKTDTSGNTSFDSFIPSGTSTEFVAGPITDEYFDPTVAPSMGF